MKLPRRQFLHLAARSPRRAPWAQGKPRLPAWAAAPECETFWIWTLSLPLSKRAGMTRSEDVPPVAEARKTAKFFCGANRIGGQISDGSPLIPLSPPSRWPPRKSDRASALRDADFVAGHSFELNG